MTQNDTIDNEIPISQRDKIASLERALWATIGRLATYGNDDDKTVINMGYRALGATSRAHIRAETVHTTDTRQERPLEPWEMKRKIIDLEKRLGQEIFRANTAELKVGQ